MATLAKCQTVAEQINGSVIRRVDYLLLGSTDPDPQNWDFGDWHWPECVIEMATDDGRVFYATWGNDEVHFELELGTGAGSQRYFQNPEVRVSVTDHDAWRRLVGVPIEVEVIPTGQLSTADSDRNDIPIALRLASDANAVWLVAAMPQTNYPEPFMLNKNNIFVGGDEIIVLLSDQLAEKLGLSRPSS